MVKPKKHLGQHFLRDENIARKIVDSLTGKTSVVAEVGPGTGILSKYLLADPSIRPYFFEIDRESVEYLKNVYPAMGEHLIECDFLGQDLSFIPEPFTVIGNFPYNISTQILFKVLDYRNQVPEVVGMFQKEVAERIASPPGSKRYGILSVLLQAYYSIEYLFTVNETVFFPPPRVKSAVIRLIRNDVANLDCNEEQFFKVVKTAFNQRRKTLRNALKPLGLKESADINALLSRRAEQLSVAEFVILTRSLQA